MPEKKKPHDFPYKKIVAIAAIILGVYFFIKAIIIAEGFLAPLLIAFVLGLVIYPLSKKMEKLGLKRAFASLVSVLILFVVSIGIVSLLFFQIQSFVGQWPEIKKNMDPKITSIENFLLEKTPVSIAQIQDFNHRDVDDFSSIIPNPGKKAWGLLAGTGSFLANYLLTLIYVFFILTYRKRNVNFVIQVLPDRHYQKIADTISNMTAVASAYLRGKLILMGTLAIAYCIGLGLSGVENFILISLVATLLTLVPYIGNVIGFILILSFGFLTTGDVGVLIGILITFAVSHFLESYVLQPYIMGGKVNVHPFLVILMVILGGEVWGIAGMILAVPVTAILTTIFLRIPTLHSIGLFFQNKDLENDS